MKQYKKIISLNKKANYNYFITKRYESGIELFGTEVKSIRAGKINLKDSYCSIDNGELHILNMHISPYNHGNIFNRDPLRVRRLLMHKREICSLYGLVKTKGFSLIPLSIYFLRSKIKLEIGLCKGKKLYDKRADIKKKEAKRRIDRSLKNFMR